MEKLTAKEEEVLELIWKTGATFPKDLVAVYPDPKPHVNTVATMFQSLERKGYLTHRPWGRGYWYEPTLSPTDYRRLKTADLVDRYYGRSYRDVVSAFVSEEKLTEQELLDVLAELRRHNKA